MFIGSALAVEEQRPGYRVQHVQIIVNEPSVGGFHQDSGGDVGASGGDDGASVCKGQASLRAISRASVLLAPQQAQAQGLGGMGFSASTTGAGSSLAKPLLGWTSGQGVQTNSSASNTAHHPLRRVQLGLQWPPPPSQQLPCRPLCLRAG
jgi:hypothetical protein